MNGKTARLLRKWCLIHKLSYRKSKRHWSRAAAADRIVWRKQMNFLMP